MAMDGLLLLLAILGLGAAPVLLTATFSTWRRVNIVGGATLLILVAIAAFGPQEPHPYIPVIAMMTIGGLLLGWLISYLITLSKSSKPDPGVQ
jgi:uncharacterized membrane protein YccC